MMMWSTIRTSDEAWPPANDVWGNEAAVLVGDFLYSRSFEMMVEVNNMRVMRSWPRTTNAIAAGEVMQLLNCNDPETTEAQYLKTIHRKTPGSLNQPPHQCRHRRPES
jgi:geranylgeranyl pyrophosphate synthase